MDKVLVEVFVPLLDRSFDLFLPAASPMYEVLELMEKAVTEMSDGRFIATDNTTLCYREDGAILNTPGEKVIRSKVKTITITANKFLKEKYDPGFIKGMDP